MAEVTTVDGRPAAIPTAEEKEDSVSMMEFSYGGRPAVPPERVSFDDGAPLLTVEDGPRSRCTVMMEQCQTPHGKRLPLFRAVNEEYDEYVRTYIDQLSTADEATPTEATTEQPVEMKTKKKEKKMTASKRSKITRAKAAAKTTGQQMGQALVGAVQAAAAVELTDRLISLMIEKLGPQAPGFAELVATPVGRAMAQIALPAILKMGTETYREGLADEGEDVSRILDWVHRAATVAVEANTAAVTTTALKFAIGAARDLLPLIMAAAGEPPPFPKGLNAGSESPTIDVSDLRVEARPKVHAAK